MLYFTSIDNMRHTKVIILGSGPAGCSAALYTARARLSPIMLCGSTPGGQLTTTTDVENYPGFANHIIGPDLMQQMIDHAAREGTEIIHSEVVKVDFSTRPFKLYDAHECYQADTVIIATGAQAKWLGLESEENFKGFGVSACATCDGPLPFLRNQHVLVVGGGNSAVEETLFITKFASKVTLIHRRDKLRAEKILQQRLFANDKVNVLWHHQLIEVIGNHDPREVTGAHLLDVNTGRITEINVAGIFIAIGHTPRTELFTAQLAMDEEGYIVTAPDSTATNIAGVFAAGDVQDKIFRQAVTAAGSGCMAALEVEKYLNLHN